MRPGAAERLRIILLGYIVRGPLGGMTWHHLNYFLGLYELGHDVWFFEDSDDYASCYNPVTYETSEDPSFGLAYAGGVFRRVGVEGRWAYYDEHTDTWHGQDRDRVAHLCASADMVINVSGVNPIRPWLASVPAKVFVDTDPVFTQIRHMTDPLARAKASMHDVFLTFAENSGQPGCTIPD